MAKKILCLFGVFVLLVLAASSRPSVEQGEKYVRSSIKKLDDGDYDGSIRDALLASGSLPASATPDFVIALSHLRMYRYDSAETYARRAVGRNGKYIPGYEVLAAAQENLRKWDSLKETCMTALAIDPSSPVLRQYLEKSLQGKKAQAASNVVVVLLLLAIVLGLLHQWRIHTKDSSLTAGMMVIISTSACAVLYQIFFINAPLIWSMNQTVPLTGVLQPVRSFMLEHDGIEGYVLFGLVLSVIALSLMLSIIIQRLKTWRVTAFVSAICGLLSAHYIVTVGFYPPEAATAMSSKSLAAVLTGTLVLAAVLVVLIQRFSTTSKVVVGLLLVPVSFVAIEPASMFDYSFIIAPAIRLLEGASPTEVYMQYDLLMSLLAAAWLHIGGALNNIECIGQASMYAFFFGSFIFSMRFFRDKRLAAVFLISLVLLRFYANMHGPSALLQVTSLRLDWWLLLVFLAHEYGPKHWTVGTLLGILVIVHRNFGLLYVAAYACFSVASLIYTLKGAEGDRKTLSKVILGEVRAWLLDSRINLTIVLSSVILSYLFFQDFTAEGALTYQRLGIGMLVISSHSGYWLVPIVMSLVVMLLWHLRERVPERYLHTALFLVFLAVSNSMYFFGRSHENNIINIIGVLLLVVFTALELVQLNMREVGDGSGVRLSMWKGRGIFRRRNASLLLALMFLVGVSYFYAQKVSTRVSLQTQRLKSGKWRFPIQVGGIDTGTVNALVASREKVYVLDRQQDFLYHYQGRYPLVGYFNPHASWVFKSSFLSFVNDLLGQGYSVVVPSYQSMMDVIPFIDYNVVRESAGINVLMRSPAKRVLPPVVSELVHVSFPDTITVRSVYRTLDLTSGVFTLQVAAIPNSTQVGAALLFAAVDENDRGVIVESTGSSAPQCRIAIGDGKGWSTIAERPLEMGNRNHIVLCGDSKTLSVYVNGSHVYAGPQSDMLRHDPATLILGAPFGQTGASRGLVREFSASGACLNASVIQSNFRQISQRKTL